MIATVINAILVILGSAIGLLFRGKIPQRFSEVLTCALALCVMSIGISSAIQTEHTLCVIICLVVGTVIGELARIEDRLDTAGEWLKGKVERRAAKGGSSNSRFTEGFVTASLLFCIGSMSVMGALEAGINQDYSIIISKGVIDGVTAVSFAATMGIGVAFSALVVLGYQGALTLLAGLVGPYLSSTVVTEMSAVGGLLIMGLAFNMLNLGKHIRVGNMLPAIFLPIAYLPLVSWLGGLF